MKKKIIATVSLLILLVVIAGQLLLFKDKSSKSSVKPAEIKREPINLRNASGESEGEAFSNHYGVVQVKIIVNQGKITDIKTLIAPAGESAPITDMSTPVLKQSIIATQSLEVDLVSGATETSVSYIQSARSAIERFNSNTVSTDKTAQIVE